MESRYNNELPDPDNRIYARPSVPRKERIQQITAEVVSSFTVLSTVERSISFIKTEANTNAATIYRVEKNIVMLL